MTLTVDLRTTYKLFGDLGKWTSVLEAQGARTEISGSDLVATDGRLALQAIAAGLSTLRRRCAVEVFSSSEYVACVAAKWCSHPTTKAAKRGLPNEILWQQLRTVSSLHDIQWHFGAGTQSEVVGATAGYGVDVGYLYDGAVPPWCESLGQYRPFSTDEMEHEAGCELLSGETTPDRIQLIKQAFHRKAHETV